MLRALALMLAVPALAAPGSDSGDLSAPERFPRDNARFVTRALFPTLTDLRFGATGDVLISHGTILAGADRGLVQLGAGVLGAGLEVGGGSCLWACSRYAPTMLVSRLMAKAAARVVYHLMVDGAAAALSHLGFYMLAEAGGAMAFVHEDVAGTVKTATTLAPFGSAGAGATYFFGNGDEIFAGGELRLTYMPAFTALFAVALQPQSLEGLGGASFVVFAGLRL